MLGTHSAIRMFFSVVIPTYNRRSLLAKALQALEQQTYNTELLEGYEIIVVDDGSTDDTLSWLEANQKDLPHVRWFTKENTGPAAARNLGVEKATGDIILFVDSDLIATPHFLQGHAEALHRAYTQYGDDKVFTYGHCIETCNLEDPTHTPAKITDFSAAFFDTKNVAIAKHLLFEVGLFDTDFKGYGWHDLELGLRLKNIGVRLAKAPQAIGYHVHPPFTLEQLPYLVSKAIQRGKTGALFYKKHPTFAVRLMVQRTVFHWWLWGILSLWGQLNEKTMAPFLQWLIERGYSELALQCCSVFLNWYIVQGVRQSSIAEPELLGGQ